MYTDGFLIVDLRIDGTMLFFNILAESDVNECLKEVKLMLFMHYWQANTTWLVTQMVILLWIYALTEPCCSTIV